MGAIVLFLLLAVTVVEAVVRIGNTPLTCPEDITTTTTTTTKKPLRPVFSGLNVFWVRSLSHLTQDQFPRSLAPSEPVSRSVSAQDLPAAYAGWVDRGNSHRETYKHNTNEDTLFFNKPLTDVNHLYNPATGTVTIPVGRAGIYWVTARASGEEIGGGVRLKVRVNGTPRFVAVGHTLPAATSAAIRLNDHDVVQVTLDSTEDIEEDTFFSIAQLTSTAAFTAVRKTNQDYHNGGVVTFPGIVTSRGVTYNTATGDVIIQHGGLYLATIRADGLDRYPSNGCMVPGVLDLNLEVNGQTKMRSVARDGHMANAVMATQLKAGDVIRVRTEQGGWVERDSLVSLARVSSRHTAGAAVFAGWVRPATGGSNPAAPNTTLHRGSLYNHDDNTDDGVTTPTTGLYILCLSPEPSPDPQSGGDFSVHVKGRPVNLVAHSRHAAPSSLCSVLHLHEGDKVKVVASGGGRPQPECFFSIVLVELPDTVLQSD